MSYDPYQFEKREAIFDEINTERDRQNEMWGSDFDDKNTINDWTSYICRYVCNASRDHCLPDQGRVFLLKAATLCVAAIETLDRNEKFALRHYDND